MMVKSKLRLDVFYKTEEQQYVFLRRIALTYRARIPLLSELFQIPEDELRTKLLDHNPGVHKGLIYLFDHDLSDQDYVRNRIILFYKKLVIAVLEKDKDAQEALVGYISDAKMKELIKNKGSQNGLSDDDILTILNYQLKYALPLRAVAEMIGYHHSSYQYRLTAILEENPKLKESYDRLTEYNLALRDKMIKQKRS